MNCPPGKTSPICPHGTGNTGLHVNSSRTTSKTNPDLTCDEGFPIGYCFNGKLFNLKRLQAKSKVQTMVPCWWHGKECLNREEGGRGYESCFIRPWQLWSQYQHQNHWGSVPVSTWKWTTVSQLPQWIEKDCKLSINSNIKNQAWHKAESLQSCCTAFEDHMLG